MSESNTATIETARQAPPGEELVWDYAEDDSGVNKRRLQYSYEVQVYESQAVLTTHDNERPNPDYNEAEHGDSSNEAKLYCQDAVAIAAMLDAPIGAVLRARGYDSAPVDPDDPERELVTIVPLVSKLAETPITADGRHRFVAYEGEEFPVQLFMEHLAKGEILLANRGKSAVHDALVHAPLWLTATPELLNKLSAKAADLMAMATASQASIDSFGSEMDNFGGPLSTQRSNPELYQRWYSAGVSLVRATDLMGRFMDKIETHLAGSTMGARLAKMPSQEGVALMSSVRALENQVVDLLQPLNSDYNAGDHRIGAERIARNIQQRALQAA